MAEVKAEDFFFTQADRLAEKTVAKTLAGSFKNDGYHSSSSKGKDTCAETSQREGQSASRLTS